jgi:hypothetical protein
MRALNSISITAVDFSDAANPGGSTPASNCRGPSPVGTKRKAEQFLLALARLPGPPPVAPQLDRGQWTS